MMQRIYCLGALLVTTLIVGCSASRPTAYMIINNENAGNAPVNMSISLTEKGDGSNTVSTTTLNKPGLHYIPGKKYKKGSYHLNVATNDGELQVDHPITLDSDRWIVISYIHGDSANIVKTHGYLDTAHSKKINGQYANLSLYVEHRRPPNL